MTYSFPTLEGFQLPLFRGVDPYYLRNPQIENLRVPSIKEQFTKRVLGGNETLKAREGNATDGYGKSAHGWIEFHQVKRRRKNGEVWETKQAWLHWEEPGGRKRSRYIPKGKFADVEESVYGRCALLDETLKLLGKKR